MKEERRSVGRPKLADNPLIKESLYMVSMCMIMIVMLVSVGVKATNANALVGNASGNGYCVVNSYKVNSTSIKLIMNCNKLVKSAKLSGTYLKKGDNGLYGYKLISIDSSKKIKYSWVSKNNAEFNKTYIINNK